MSVKTHFVGAVVAAVLMSSPASAALIQITFADDADAFGKWSISGQFTLDTGVPAGTYTGSDDLYEFGAAALHSFDAVVTEIATGTTLTTLGVDFGAPAGAIRVQQGFGFGPTFGPPLTGLGVDLHTMSGVRSLTGLDGELTFQLSTLQNSSQTFVPNLLYASSDKLLDGLKTTPPITRANFDTVGVGFGWTGVFLTGLPGGNAFFQLDSVSFADVTPTTPPTNPPTTPIPLPAGLPLLLAGLGALSALRRRA